MVFSNNEINWYPGHMQKAIRRIQEKLKVCDGVIEVGDARAPFSSLPSYLDKVTSGKTKVFVFSKSDLADPIVFAKQKKELSDKGISSFDCDLRNKKSGKELLKYLSSVKTSQDKRYEKLGFPLPTKRYMVIGIPNVGKSTLINSLTGTKKAAVENRPGKTRAETMIHVSDRIYVFDTPGVLEPNYQDKEVITKLALLGSVKQEILPFISLTDALLDFLKEHYLDNLKSRYQVSFDRSNEEVFEDIAVFRHFMTSGNVPDAERSRLHVLTEFRNGLLGRISLDA